MPAKKILIAYDFGKNEIQNTVAHVLASAPSTPAPGQFYYNSTTGRFVFRNATTWIDPTDRSTHTGTQTAATISDFASTAQSYRLDQFAAPTAPVSLNSQRMANVSDPSAAQDAATKNYVDNLLNGTDWKASVRCATTANITLSGLLTLDGVTLLAGQRALVKNQTVGTENGLYVAASGVWSRTLDADGAGELTPATAVMVEEGTTLADTQWRITTDGTITLGTTAIAWAQIGQGTTYTAGLGISIAGNVLAIDTTVVARKFSATIGDGTSNSIAVTHSLGTQDIEVSIRDAATNAFVETDYTATSTSQVTFFFTSPPALSSYRVVVVG